MLARPSPCSSEATQFQLLTWNYTQSSRPCPTAAVVNLDTSFTISYGRTKSVASRFLMYGGGRRSPKSQTAQQPYQSYHSAWRAKPRKVRKKTYGELQVAALRYQLPINKYEYKLIPQQIKQIILMSVNINIPVLGNYKLLCVLQKFSAKIQIS